jgi:hypothetical protein
VERGAVCEVAAQPIQAFRQHAIETARFRGAHQVPQSGTIGHGGARDRRVGELRSHVPALPGGMLARQGELVGYRSDVLEVRAEPGVDGDAHGNVPSLACSAA